MTGADYKICILGLNMSESLCFTVFWKILRGHWGVAEWRRKSFRVPCIWTEITVSQSWTLTSGEVRMRLQKIKDALLHPTSPSEQCMAGLWGGGGGTGNLPKPTWSRPPLCGRDNYSISISSQTVFSVSSLVYGAAIIDYWWEKIGNRLLAIYPVSLHFLHDCASVQLFRAVEVSLFCSNISWLFCGLRKVTGCFIHY